MLKFFCGAALGVLITIAIYTCNNADKLGACLIGVLVGVALLSVGIIIFVREMSDTKKLPEEDLEWWQKGDKNPYDEKD